MPHPEKVPASFVVARNAAVVDRPVRAKAQRTGDMRCCRRECRSQRRSTTSSALARFARIEELGGDLRLFPNQVLEPRNALRFDPFESNL